MSSHRHYWNGDTTDPAPAPAPSAPTPAPTQPTLYGVPIPAGWVQVDVGVYAKPDSGVNASTAIAGYRFINIAYMECALWMSDVLNAPGFVALPPVTSVTTTIDVSGTVGG